MRPHGFGDQFGLVSATTIRNDHLLDQAFRSGNKQRRRQTAMNFVLRVQRRNNDRQRTAGWFKVLADEPTGLTENRECRESAPDERWLTTVEVGTSAPSPLKGSFSL